MIIDVSDPVYSFSEVMDRMDLGKHLAVKECRTGRPRYDAEKLLKIILFSFMENGYLSLRNIRKACKTDIRYLWLLDGMEAPSHVTIGSFIRNEIRHGAKKKPKRARRRICAVIYRKLTLAAPGCLLYEKRNEVRNSGAISSSQ